MRIIKILNNNSVVLTDGKIESVAMGRGLAFGKKIGDEINESEITKIYNLKTNELTERLADIFQSVDSKVFDFCKNEIDEMKIELEYNLQDSIYINLPDHIQAVLNRYKNDEKIVNTLALDIQRFYPAEYRMAKKFVNKLNKEFNVELDENEVGFIVLHIIDASINSSLNSYSIKVTTMIKDVVNIVRRYFQMEIDENSICYYRFVCHLRFFGQRLFTNTDTVDSNDDQEILQTIAKKYQRSFDCAKMISKYIRSEYNHETTCSEMLYLTIHIQRIYEEYNYKEKERQ